jgi:hypothetical protein
MPHKPTGITCFICPVTEKYGDRQKFGQKPGNLVVQKINYLATKIKPFTTIIKLFTTGKKSLTTGEE